MTAVDVIVPCYNYGRFLPDCIGSVLAQEGIRVRALIIDDASTDDSAAIARRLARQDERVTVVEHRPNRGHIDTYNEGLDWAAADYLLLLSADDMLAPGALRRAVSVMEAHQDVGMVYGRSLKFVGDDKPTGETATPDEIPTAILEGQSFIGALCRNPTNPVETATVVVRTAIQKRVGGYRKQLPHAGDLEMWLRFAAMGRLAFIDEVQAFTRIHGRNMRHDYAANLMIGDYKQRLEAFEMFFAAYAHAVPEARRLRMAVRRSLADEVLWAAAKAFEAGEPGSVPCLAHLARSICPQAIFKPLWAKLWLRRLIGLQGWRCFAPWVDKTRALRHALHRLRLGFDQRAIDDRGHRAATGIGIEGKAGATGTSGRPPLNFDLASSISSPGQAEQKVIPLGPMKEHQHVRRALVAISMFVTVACSDSASSRTLQVGHDQTYSALSKAVADAGDGDTIELLPGTYYDCAVVGQDNLTIQGAGPNVILTDTACQGKALLVVTGNNITIRNLTLQRARVPDGNGAGIRAEGGNLTVENCRFLNNENGILGASNPDATISVSKSAFIGNGKCADSCAHAIYVNHVQLLRVVDSVFKETRQGHHIKSRAARTEIVGNDIQDGPDGTSSYLIDVPNGGSLVVERNRLQKGPNSDNAATAIAIGAEGVTQPTDELVFSGNSFTNDQSRPTTFVRNVTATPAVLAGEIFQGEVWPLAGDGSVRP